MSVKINHRVLWLLAASLPTGLLMAQLDSSPNFWVDWMIYTLLLAAGSTLILLASRAVRAEIEAEWASWAGFWLRLVVGVVLWFVLPLSGYTDNPATTNGYLFKDAYFRDQEAWDLAQSDDSLFAAYGSTFNPGGHQAAYTTDQYGGVLALSGFVYRYISSDVHRPFAILVLTSTAMALGTLFAWGAAKSWFGNQTALAAAWIFSLFPEGVLLGASQMREPLVLGALALATYSASLIQHKRHWLLWVCLGGVFLLLFQSPVALIALFVLGISVFLEPGSRFHWKRVLVFAGIMAAVILVVMVVWSSLPSLKDSSPLTLFFTWLENNYKYQGSVTERASGQVQRLLALLGENFRLVIYVIYGAARPVLPAALSDVSANPVWYIINLFRAVGWYLLVPLMAYATIHLFKRGEIYRRRQLIWLALASWILVFIAAANGGADAWDNPRYRAIFLVWQALLAAWGWIQARENRDPWLKRLLLMEAVFVLIFAWWYVSRLPELAAMHPSVEIAVGVCILTAVIIIGAGLILDRKRRKQGI